MYRINVPTAATMIVVTTAIRTGVVRGGGEGSLNLDDDEVISRG